MELSKLFDYRYRFHSENDVQKYIVNSMNYEGEDPSDAEALLIFKTSKQKTWLLATRERFYCILDDSRKDKLHINWSIDKEALIKGKNVIVDIQTKDKTEKTGLLDIGKNHRNWLFTKKLFEKENIQDLIVDLIAKKMINE